MQTRIDAANRSGRLSEPVVSEAVPEWVRFGGCRARAAGRARAGSGGARSVVPRPRALTQRRERAVRDAGHRRRIVLVGLVGGRRWGSDEPLWTGSGGAPHRAPHAKPLRLCRNPTSHATSHNSYMLTRTLSPTGFHPNNPPCGAYRTRGRSSACSYLVSFSFCVGPLLLLLCEPGFLVFLASLLLFRASRQPYKQEAHAGARGARAHDLRPPAQSLARGSGVRPRRPADSGRAAHREEPPAVRPVPRVARATAPARTPVSTHVRARRRAQRPRAASHYGRRPGARADARATARRGTGHRCAEDVKPRPTHRRWGMRSCEDQHPRGARGDHGDSARAGARGRAFHESCARAPGRR
jgi:hypothetical protein